MNFRMPAELKEKLEASAKEAGRSTTAEIVSRLEESYAAPSSEGVLNALARLEFSLATREAELRVTLRAAHLLAMYLQGKIPSLEKQAVEMQSAEAQEGVATLKKTIDWIVETARSSGSDEDVIRRMREASDQFRAAHGVTPSAFFSSELAPSKDSTPKK